MGLSVRAMARATEPSAELLPAAVDGLRREGLDAAEPKPRALSSEEASGAAHVDSGLVVPHARRQAEPVTPSDR